LLFGRPRSLGDHDDFILNYLKERYDTKPKYLDAKTVLKHTLPELKKKYNIKTKIDYSKISVDKAK